MKQQKIEYLLLNNVKVNQFIQKESQDGWYVKQIDSFVLPAGKDGGISSEGYIIILFEKD